MVLYNEFHLKDFRLTFLAFPHFKSFKHFLRSLLSPNIVNLKTFIGFCGVLISERLQY